MHIQGGRGERVSGPTEIEGVMARMLGWMKVKKERAGRGYLPKVVRYSVENKKIGGRRPVRVEG